MTRMRLRAALWSNRTNKGFQQLDIFAFTDYSVMGLMGSSIRSVKP